MRVASMATALGLALGLACGNDDELEPGTEGGPCWGGEFCPEPLVCGSGFCVLPPELEGMGSEGGNAGGEGPRPGQGDGDGGADGSEDPPDDPPGSIDCPSACTNYINVAEYCWNENLGESWYSDVCIPDCEGGYDEPTLSCVSQWTGACMDFCDDPSCADALGINCNAGTTDDPDPPPDDSGGTGG